MNTTNPLIKLIEPLCRTEDLPLTALQIEMFTREAVAYLATQVVYSEALNKMPTTSHELRDWIDLATTNNITNFRAWAVGMAPWHVKVGMFFGDPCQCCGGWRVVVAFLAGALLVLLT